MKQYINIYNGWIREKGDQVRSKDIGCGISAKSTDKPVPGGWQEVTLIGHTILRSDLMHAEFRRPV